MINKILGGILSIIIIFFAIDYFYIENTHKTCQIACTCQSTENCLCGEQKCGIIKDKTKQDVYFYGRYW